MFGEGISLCVEEPEIVAKKKAAPEKTRSKQGMVLAYKADEKSLAILRSWLERLALHVGVPTTVVVDLALKDFAAKHKFEPMPRRLVR
jgi:hypothetical protein